MPINKISPAVLPYRKGKEIYRKKKAGYISNLLFPLEHGRQNEEEFKFVSRAGYQPAFYQKGIPKCLYMLIHYDRLF